MFTDLYVGPWRSHGSHSGVRRGSARFGDTTWQTRSEVPTGASLLEATRKTSTTELAASCASGQGSRPRSVQAWTSGRGSTVLLYS